MRRDYIERGLEAVLRKAAKEFPAIVLTGPRQSGKTTLLRHVFGTGYRYVSLEPPEVRASAAADPKGFIEINQPPVVLEEVQYAPGLLPYVKEKVDAKRSKAGQYILTGSQNLLLMERVTESLAGRAAMLKLLPLSVRETVGTPHAVFPWEKETTGVKREKMGFKEAWHAFLRGGYPEVVADPNRDAVLWHSSYVQTYLERDVRTLRQIGDLTQFQVFLKTLASRSGQLLDLTEVSRDLGIAVNTVKAWLSVLEATFQIVILRPYHVNVGKRLVRTPKVYFTDVGTLCYLVGLRDYSHAMNSPMNGAIFETVVFSEILKTLLSRGLEPSIYFWRTSTGMEVDFIIEAAGKLIPIEVKNISTAKPEMAAGITAFQKDYGNKAAEGYVVNWGDTYLALAPKVKAMPFWVF